MQSVKDDQLLLYQKPCERDLRWVKSLCGAFASLVVNLSCGQDWQTGQIPSDGGLMAQARAVPIALKLPLSWINYMNSLCDQGWTQPTAHLQAARV